MERSGSSGNGTGNGTGSSSGNIGNGTGNTSGNYSGNYSGSGRAAPPGGAGLTLLCLALLLPLPPARALPTPARTLPSAARTLPSAARTLPSPARALPTPARHSHPLAQCLNRSWDLLEATNNSLHRLKERGVLRFNCTFEEVDVEDITENQINTISACTAEDPGPGNCPVLERSTFDEGKCLQGISEDLRAYRPHLRNLEDPQLLAALDALMEALRNRTGKDPEAPSESGSVGSSMGSSVGSSMGSSMGSSVGSSMGSSMGSSVGSSMGSPMGSSVGSPMGSPMGSSMGSSVGSSMGSSVGSPMGSSVGSPMGSSVGSTVGLSVGSSVGSLGLGRTPFPERLRLCGALLAFRVRSVTISRMLNFLSSL